MHGASLHHWRDATLALIRDSGARGTRGREVVVTYLSEHPGCLSAGELAVALRTARSPVGVATVYRTLDLLHGLGALVTHDLGDRVTRFEPVLPDGMDHHHHHLVCLDCGRVELFSNPELEGALERAAASLQALVEDHEVVLHGHCALCR